MNQELFKLALEGAKAEGKRIREAVEAAGGKDKPLSVVPIDGEQWILEIDFRDGEVSLRQTYGSGVSQAVADGHAMWIGLDSATSTLALAGSLEGRGAETIAELAALEPDDSGFGRIDVLKQDVADLSRFWIVDLYEFYESDMPTGAETDDELAIMAAAIHTCDPQIYPTFDEDEAFEWLRARRTETFEEMDEAA
jgi:hypothetical protein